MTFTWRMMIINTFATTMTNKVKFRSKDPRGSRGRDREKCRERERLRNLLKNLKDMQMMFLKNIC